MLLDFLRDSNRPLSKIWTVFSLIFWRKFSFVKWAGLPLSHLFLHSLDDDKLILTSAGDTVGPLMETQAYAWITWWQFNQASPYSPIVAAQLFPFKVPSSIDFADFSVPPRGTRSSTYFSRSLLFSPSYPASQRWACWRSASTVSPRWLWYFFVLIACWRLCVWRDEIWIFANWISLWWHSTEISDAYNLLMEIHDPGFYFRYIVSASLSPPHLPTYQRF